MKNLGTRTFNFILRYILRMHALKFYIGIWTYCISKDILVPWIRFYYWIEISFLWFLHSWYTQPTEKRESLLKRKEKIAFFYRKGTHPPYLIPKTLCLFLRKSMQPVGTYITIVIFSFWLILLRLNCGIFS